MVNTAEEITRLTERKEKIRTVALEEMVKGNYDGKKTVFEGMNIKQLCSEHATLITKIARLHRKENT